MNDTIENIIDSIKDSLDYTDLGYYDGQSVDRRNCPICGADEVIKYGTNQYITMNTLEHTDDCAYTLIRKLEKQLEDDFHE